MSSSRRGRRPDPCSHENCGSRRFHVGDDGYTYCDQGHQQSERGAVVAEDTGELLNLGRKSRRRVSDEESSISRVSGLSRSQAFEHYLLCVQLVLRKQLKWLVEAQKLPSELEIVVRDLWTLRLSKLKRGVSFDNDTDTEVFSSQAVSSQSERDTDFESLSQSTQRTSSRADPAKSDVPGLIETLALSYIGVLLQRIPVTVHDIHGWVNDGKLLYYQAAREVPLELRERLPGVFQEMLEPQNLLQPQWLHDGVLETLNIFHRFFGMAVPPINHPLLVYRWMRDLALPVEVFAGTERLANLLDINFEFGFGLHDRSAMVTRYPEVRLMAVVLTAVKLLFPFDSIRRYARSETDLSATSVDWDHWQKIQEGPSERESPLSFEEAFSFSAQDCVEASDDRLDEYLRWCEENITSAGIRERGRAGRDADFRRTLHQMFPLPKHTDPSVSNALENSQDKTAARISEVQSTLVARPVVEAGVAPNRKINRPGSFYKRFRTVEDLSGPSKTLFERAAILAGISVEGMVRAVFWVETKMWKHEERLRKES